LKSGLRSSDDIIRAANNNELPDKIMITVHPQRWTNNYPEWIREYAMQKAKNLVKQIFFVR